jgi:hypothetical protein
MAKTKKPRKIGEFKVAYRDNGDLCDGVYSWMSNPQYASQTKWEDNTPFVDTLEYDTYYSNRIVFKSAKTGRSYGMFMSDFDEVLKNRRLIDNQIVGLFCITRRGVKQGVRVIFEDIP